MTNRDKWIYEKETGRYYRMFGTCKEYAPDYVFAHNKSNLKIKSESQKREEQEQNRETGKQCPIKHGVHCECVTDCPLYGVTACIMRTPEKAPPKETKGAYCPIKGTVCGEECALYFEGCGLRKLANGIITHIEGKEGS